MNLHSYHTPDDGKLHTRYTELHQCTPNQINRVVAHRVGLEDPFVSEAMAFGTERHGFFEREAEETGQLPAIFQRTLPWVAKDVSIDAIEKEYAVELVRGVVVHSRPDAISIEAQTIFDYKTVTEGSSGFDKKVRNYWSSWQLPFYAMMLDVHGIKINRVVYLCEVWNPERDKIVAHRQIVRDISETHIAQVKDWAQQRIALLKVAMAQYQEESASS